MDLNGLVLFIHSCLESDLHSPHPRLVEPLGNVPPCIMLTVAAEKSQERQALDWFVGKDIVASLRLVVIDEVNFPPKLFPSMDERMINSRGTTGLHLIHI